MLPERLEMVERQLRRRGITGERVLAAMAAVPREAFVPESWRAHAYDDAALPIAEAQTISQPFMVARMCELLALDGDERVLEVGTGSGYQAAVLAELAAEVHSIERYAVLAERARAALRATGYERVRVHLGDGSLGLPEYAPFGGIVVAAAAPAVPQPLYDQLTPDARLVVPVGALDGQQLQVVTRGPEGPLIAASVPCRFVPLVGAAGFSDEGV